MRDDSVVVAEKCLAAAHRQLNHAKNLAGDWADLQWHDDLQMFLLELERMQVDFLRGRSSRSVTLTRRTYLSDSGSDDRRPTT